MHQTKAFIPAIDFSSFVAEDLLTHRADEHEDHESQLVANVTIRYKLPANHRKDISVDVFSLRLERKSAAHDLVITQFIVCGKPSNPDPKADTMVIRTSSWDAIGRLALAEGHPLTEADKWHACGFAFHHMVQLFRQLELQDGHHLLFHFNLLPYRHDASTFLWNPAVFNRLQLKLCNLPKSDYVALVPMTFNVKAPLPQTHRWHKYVNPHAPPE